MELRMRLALTTVAVAIPVALCMGWIHLVIETRAVTVLHGWSLKLGRSEYGGLQVDFLGEESAPGQKDA